MTPQDILKECQLALLEGAGFVNLVFPKGTSTRIKGFPRGELLCENHGGARVMRYDAVRLQAAVLAALGMKVVKPSSHNAASGDSHLTKEK